MYTNLEAIPHQTKNNYTHILYKWSQCRVNLADFRLSPSLYLLRETSSKIGSYRKTWWGKVVLFKIWFINFYKTILLFFLLVPLGLLSDFTLLPNRTLSTPSVSVSLSFLSLSLTFFLSLYFSLSPLFLSVLQFVIRPLNSLLCLLYSVN